MDADDTELLAWRGGDLDAGDALTARHFDGVCRFFRSKLGDDVDDLIQRTFLAIVERREAIEPGGFRGYLFATARNVLFDHLRMRYRRPEHDALGESSVADLGTSPSQALARHQRERLLLDALRLLPLDHQIALELAYWEELRGPEIARVLGVPANTVRSRLARARQSLRDALERLGAAPAAIAETLDGVDRALPAG